jgi:phosphoribosylaminoimidazole-succinocarboxamide synthase
LDFRKGKILQDGRTKRVYLTQVDGRWIVSFKDEACFYDGGELCLIKNRGRLAASSSTAFFRLLENYHILTYFIQPLKANELLVQQLEPFPIQVVVWNYGSSHFSKRFGLERGKPLDYPVIEFYMKTEKGPHPMIGQDHVIAFSLAKEFEIVEMIQISRKVNAVLKSFFERRNLVLADFQLEFGRSDKGILVCDEISPDTCRLWDLQNGQIDMNRFRPDRGHCQTVCLELFERIGFQP